MLKITEKINPNTVLCDDGNIYNIGITLADLYDENGLEIYKLINDHVVFLSPDGNNKIFNAGGFQSIQLETVEILLDDVNIATVDLGTGDISGEEFDSNYDNKIDIPKGLIQFKLDTAPADTSTLVIQLKTDFGTPENIDYTLPENEDDYNIAITKKEMELQAEDLRECALKNIASMQDIVKSLQLKVTQQEVQIRELLEQLNPANPNQIMQFTFNELFDNEDKVDTVNSDNYKHVPPNSSNNMDGLIMPINKNQNTEIKTIDLGPDLGAVHKFQIIAHGRVPECNVGFAIEVYNASGQKQQLLDENDDPQDYVVYSGEETLSDIMHFATPITEFVMKLTMIPRYFYPEQPVTGVPFISAYSLIYSKEA